MIIMHFTWDENYGDTLNTDKVDYSEESNLNYEHSNFESKVQSKPLQSFNSKVSSVLSTLTETCNEVWSQKELLYLGLSQSLFEGAMYAFVFMWNPVLEQAASMSATATFYWVRMCFFKFFRFWFRNVFFVPILNFNFFFRFEFEFFS